MIWVGVVLALGIGAAVVEGPNGTVGRILKMAASTAVIAFLLLSAQEPSPYMWMLLGALTLSWVGDLALSFTGRKAFIVGLVAFAAAHIVYTGAFLVRGSLDPIVLVLAGAVMTAFGVVILQWLGPHRPRELRLPLIVYVVVISAMVTAAFATQGENLDPRIPLGALAFAASDVLVARQQFVTSTPWNRIVGLPLYFAAQLLLAASVSAGT